MKKKTISDTDLKVIIKARLKKDAVYYTDFLKDLIDSVPCKAPSPKTFFELVTPDRLFYPEMRKTLRKWQIQYVRGRFSRNIKQREKASQARDYLEQVGKSLVAVGQGRPKTLSYNTEQKLSYDFPLVDSACKEIFKRAKFIGVRSSLVRKYFPNEAEAIIRDGIPNAPAKLRDLVLCTRFKIVGRSLKEFQTRHNKFRKELSEEFPDVFPPVSK